MATEEPKGCPVHGPYLAHLGACPDCARMAQETTDFHERMRREKPLLALHAVIEALSGCDTPITAQRILESAAAFYGIYLVSGDKL